MDKQRLKQWEFFRGLPSEISDAVLEVLEEQTYAAGDTLFAEGEPSEHLYFVGSGYIDAYKKQGEESTSDVQLLRTLHAGEIIGLTSFLQDERKRSATLIAKNKVTVWALPHKELNALLSKQKEAHGWPLVESFLLTLAEKTRHKNRLIANLMSGGDQPQGLDVSFFDAKPYMREAFDRQNNGRFRFRYFDVRLDASTLPLASGSQVVCAFVNDQLDAEVLRGLKRLGVGMVALRCAGFNNIDLPVAKEEGLVVTRVPEYSPYSVAEHAVALLLSLNRKIHLAHQRIRTGNFTLDGFVGFDLHGKTVGVVGLGKIGAAFAQIMAGFGCQVIAVDKERDESKLPPGGRFVEDIDELLKQSDVVSLHVPLLPDTHHLIDEKRLALMKPTAFLINTSRGGLVEASAMIDALKAERIAGAALDVYEEEQAYFFEDHSSRVIKDDVLARLLTFQNVVITSHQAFLTHEALVNIADSTLESMQQFSEGAHERGQMTHRL